RASEVRLKRDSLDRRLGMELERQPCQMDEAFLLEAFASDRVDVAPGSDVVGKDDQIGRGHARSLATKDPPPVVGLSSTPSPKSFFRKPRNLPKNHSSLFQTGDMLRKLFRGSS